ncbi:MAG: flagellar brake protein [Gammaproteobacteria bacterium]|nr:flagellar brake protein [Gammaproteobacteria bacterium]MBU1646219.1 flagellar brake protein [Gammaproteobacteria bacterium]MBU1972281.1 flagellar brake protein [Gammaproteobacteria bacterium]
MSPTAAPQENLDDYTITFQREIVFYLHQLISDGDRISVMFNEGRDTLLTVLLDVDEAGNRLIFDWGGSEDGNRRFLRSERNIFVASPHGIRNQFVTGPAREVSYRKRRAFAVALPDKYIRLQRREFFRLVLPMMRRPPCRVLLGPPGEEQEHLFSVIDIGVGGVGLESSVTSLPLEIGQILPGAIIDLKGPSVLRLDLEVRYLGQLTRGIHQVGHIGCRFARLSPAQEHELQKFITQVQREERAKLG